MLGWIALQFCAGLLMSLAHPFRWNEIEIDPGILNFISASVGIAVFMKVSSLRSKGRTRFLLGLWGAWVFYFVSLYWIVFALKVYGELPAVLALFSAAALSLYCALYLGVWSWLCGLTRVRDLSIFHRIIIWASLWAGLETLREYLLTGFPWAEIGQHFAAWPSIAKTASLWGVHGLSFWWIVVVSIVLHLDEWWQSKKARMGVATLAVLIVLTGAISHYLYFDRSPSDSKDFKVSIIQPNIDQGIKWNAPMAGDHLQNLIELTRSASQSRPDLIVWPETAYPFLLANNQRQMPFESNTPLLFGAVLSEARMNRNSAILLQDDQMLSRYDKVQLVPFGEYVPFEDYLPFEKLVANVGRFLAGSIDQEDIVIKDVNIGPLICYEDIFSAHSVHHARSGAQLLVNLTNDAWYGRSSALAQHAALSKLQAYQTALPLVRATNTGLSLSLDFSEEKELEINKQEILTSMLSIPTNPTKTFFVLTYPLMQWIWWIIFAIAFLWKSKVPRKRIFFHE